MSEKYQEWTPGPAPSELAKRPAGELANPNPVASMLQALIDKGGSVEGAGALAKLYMEMEAYTAKKDFALAFAECQARIPAVIANGRNTHLGTSYATLEDMQDAIDPLAKAHDLSISFDSDILPNGMMRVDCILTHKFSGHSERRGIAVMVGTSPNKAVTTTQVYVGALKTGKRCALANMFNLKIDYDGDARLLGEVITADQAAALEQRLTAIGRDRAKFLKLAAAESFETIRSGKFAMLDAFLTKAERQRPNIEPATTIPGGRPPNDDPLSEAEKAAIRAQEAKEAQR